jgi:hypothetical protein
MLPSDLTKIDACGVEAADYEEIPELSDEFFVQAEHHRSGVLVKRGRGRPPGAGIEGEIAGRTDS